MIDYLIAEYQAASEISMCNILAKLRNEIAPHFSVNPANKIVESYCLHNTDTSQLNDRFSQPSPIFQLYNLTSSLQLYFEEPATLQGGLRESMDSLAKKLVQASSHQLKVLFQALEKIISVTETKRQPASPIIILELPLGNSIPCQLLAYLLKQKDIPYEIVKISLNRNDTKKAGITRTQLLQERLLAKEGSFLIYLDEWVTGSNFDTVAGILSKIPDIVILPVALLEYEASTRPNFEKYCLRHEEHCKAVGENSNSLRFTVPTLNENIKSEQPFIWAEHDRIAGYRKLDFAGNFVYSINFLIKSLLDDPAILDRYLENLSQFSPSMKAFIRPSILGQCRTFIDSYWPKWEEAIKRSVLFNQADPEEIVNSALELLRSTGDFNDVKLAIRTAGEILSGQIDSINRYPYKERVPFCEPLIGEELLAHQLFIKEYLRLF